MGIQEAVLACLTKYVEFEGRATRSECWWWALFVVAVWVILWVMGGALLGADSGAGPVSGALFCLAAFPPGLAVAARRGLAWRAHYVTRCNVLRCDMFDSRCEVS